MENSLNHSLIFGFSFGNDRALLQMQKQPKTI